MTDYKSDVARIRQQIEDEYRVMQLMESGLAITAKHQFIDARMHQIEQHCQELTDLVGKEEAIQAVIEINNRCVTPLPSHDTTTVVLQGNSFIDGYHDGFSTFLDTHNHTTFTDQAIYDLFSTILYSVLHPGVYNAGFLVGWTAALHHARALPAQIVEG